MAKWAPFVYGRVRTTSCRLIALEWDSRLLGDAPEPAVLDDVAKEPGVYAIEGCHDGSRTASLLYIGQTGGRSARTIPDRLPESMEKIWWQAKDDKKLRLYSDVWDVKVRWAPILDAACIESIERLLIVAHAPAYNQKHVREDLPEECLDLVVLNAGKKGGLLPTVVGAYYRGGPLWPHSAV